MATTALGGVPAHLVGELPTVGSAAPAFSLTDTEFGEVTLPQGTRTVLNIFPSVATGVCSASVRKFNELAAGLDNAEVICVSQDLPFAVANFCAAEGLDAVLVGSAFRSGFGTDYGVTMADGNWRGLLARAVVVLDEDGTVLHAELTSAIGVEPDYDAAIAALG